MQLRACRPPMPLHLNSESAIETTAGPQMKARSAETGMASIATTTRMSRREKRWPDRLRRPDDACFSRRDGARLATSWVTSCVPFVSLAKDGLRLAGQAGLHRLDAGRGGVGDEAQDRRLQGRRHRRCGVPVAELRDALEAGHRL